MRMRASSAAAAAAFGVFAGSSSAAMLIVDSGEPDPQGQIAGIFYDADEKFDSQFIAVGITFADAVDLTRMEFHFQGGAGNQLTVHLTDHLGDGTTMDNVLHQMSLTGPGTPGSWVGEDVDLSLAAGDYFLVFSAPAFHNMGMNLTAPNSVGQHFTAIGTSAHGLDGAFAPASSNWFANPFVSVGVRMYAVPAPGPITLAGLTALLAARRRRIG